MTATPTQWQTFFDAWLARGNLTTQRRCRCALAALAATARIEDPRRALEHAAIHWSGGRLTRAIFETVAALAHRGLKGSTIRAYLGEIRRLLQAAASAGLLAEYKWSDVRVPRVPRVSAWHAPERSTVEAMMTACEHRADAKGARDLAAIWLLYGAALRPGEALALDVCDVDFGNREIVLHTGTWRMRRPWPMTRPVAEAVHWWLTFRGDKAGPLLTALARGGETHTRLSARGLHTAIRTLGLAAGARRVSPLSLRKAAARVAFDRSGGNVLTAMTLLRLSDPRDAEAAVGTKDSRSRDGMELISAGNPV